MTCSVMIRKKQTLPHIYYVCLIINQYKDCNDYKGT